MLLVFTLAVAPIVPEVFVPICAVAEGEGGPSVARSLASGITIAANLISRLDWHCRLMREASEPRRE